MNEAFQIQVAEQAVVFMHEWRLVESHSKHHNDDNTMPNAEMAILQALIYIRAFLKVDPFWKSSIGESLDAKLASETGVYIPDATIYRLREDVLADGGLGTISKINEWGKKLKSQHSERKDTLESTECKHIQADCDLLINKMQEFYSSFCVDLRQMCNNSKSTGYHSRTDTLLAAMRRLYDLLQTARKLEKAIAPITTDIATSFAKLSPLLNTTKDPTAKTMLVWVNAAHTAYQDRAKAAQLTVSRLRADVHDTIRKLAVRFLTYHPDVKTWLANATNGGLLLYYEPLTGTPIGRMQEEKQMQEQQRAKDTGNLPERPASSRRPLPVTAINAGPISDDVREALTSSALSLPLPGVEEGLEGKDNNNNAQDGFEGKKVGFEATANATNTATTDDELAKIHVPFATRIFIGPHIARIDFSTKTKGKQAKHRSWYHTLVKGHEKAALEATNTLWAGDSFEIGANEAAAYRRLVVNSAKKDGEEATDNNLDPKPQSPKSSPTVKARDMHGKGELADAPAVLNSAKSPSGLLDTLQSQSVAVDDKGKEESRNQSDLQDSVPSIFLPPKDGNIISHEPDSISTESDSPGVTFYTPMAMPEYARQGDAPPASPEVVLARADDEEHIPKQTRFHKHRLSRREPIYREEVMLFASAWTKSEIPHDFNDSLLRRYDIRMKPWQEVKVIWVGHRIEIHRIRQNRPDKLINTLSLVAAGVRLSSFTSADYTICLSCPEASRRRALISRLKTVRGQSQSAANSHLEVHESTTGTALFYLRPAFATRATDWYLDLWRHIGGTIPDSLDVHIPKVNVRISVPVPQSWEEAATSESQHDSLEPWTALTTSVLLNTCLDRLKRIEQFRTLLEGCQHNGWEPHLVWRRGDFLDLLLHETDVDEKQRTSPIMAGHALSHRFNGLSDGLELRMMMPYPTRTPLKHGESMDEPEAVEGYVTRLHGATLRDRIYLCSIGPNLYLTPASQSTPPDPPVHFTATDYIPKQSRAGVFGGPYSIDHAQARKLEQTRTALQKEKLATAKARLIASNVNQETEEISAESLACRYQDNERARLFSLIKTSRGFIDLRHIASVQIQDSAASSPVIRVDLPHGQHFAFECSSKGMAAEWSSRLSQLKEYWKARKDLDAAQQIALHSESAAPVEHYIPQSQRRFLAYKDRLEEDDTFLTLAYNLSFARGEAAHPFGIRLYVRKGEDARSKQRRCVVINGHLVMFRTLSHTFGGKPVFPVFYPRKTCLSLKDCYVVTGSLCGEWRKHIPEEGYSAAGAGLRVYGDQLTSADSQEDCTFALWRRGKIGQFKQSNPLVYVLVARSRLERDQAVYVINTEIERVRRADNRSDGGQVADGEEE